MAAERGPHAAVLQLFHFAPANPTGHYRLNLGSQHDKELAWMLVGCSGAERDARRALAPAAADTSQAGDWGCWRNVRLTTVYKGGRFAEDYSDGAPFAYDDSVAEPLPPHGVLELDYASTETHHREAGKCPRTPVRP